MNATYEDVELSQFTRLVEVQRFQCSLNFILHTRSPATWFNIATVLVHEICLELIRSFLIILCAQNAVHTPECCSSTAGPDRKSCNSNVGRQSKVCPRTVRRDTCRTLLTHSFLCLQQRRFSRHRTRHSLPSCISRSYYPRNMFQRVDSRQNFQLAGGDQDVVQ